MSRTALKNKAEFTDLHVHTYHSLDSRASTLSVLQQAVKRKLTAIALTDHDRWAAVTEAWELQKKHPELQKLLIVPGIEVTTLLVTRWGIRIPHVILLNAHPDVLKKFLWWTPIPWFPFTERLLLWAAQQPEIVTVIPHSQPEGDMTSLSFSEIHRWRHWIDALEVVNEKANPSLDAARTRLAQELELGITGSSDAHISTHVGDVMTATKEHIESVSDLMTAIRGRKTYAVVR